MPKQENPNFSPRINNRRAMHDYFIEAKIEVGIKLVGSEVKSLRQGKAQLAESFALVERGQLFLHGCHIDQYEKSNQMNHEPKRIRVLLAHKREIRKLLDATSDKGTTLVPLAMYFKNGYAKVEIGIARGKQHHDKRDSIKKKEMDRDMRRAMTKRQ